jgi:uncharacterized tellurite resistance protein B-like protein
MEKLSLNRLLLKTAFSCMACDGEIDNREVILIKSMHDKYRMFGEIDIDHELDSLLVNINREGHKFLRKFFQELTHTSLTEQDELKLIEVAIDTIKADDKVEYSEIKFFKVIRSKLKVSNEKILAVHPDFEEYLEQDIISESYLMSLQNDFFDYQELPEFDPLTVIGKTGINSNEKDQN